MQCQLIGVSHMHGTAKASQKPYAIYRAKILSPMTDFDSDTTHRRCYGFEEMELECEPTAFEKIRLLQFPIVGKMEIENQPKSGKLVPVCVGFKAAA